jgi:Ran GTPase-activating protein (RanGAP) involved in mRNA processing and transport
MIGCGIGVRGAERIGELLEKNKSLVEINLEGNGEIGDEGAIRIAEGLEKNTSLIRLNLYRVFPPPSFFIHCWISYSFIS